MIDEQLRDYARHTSSASRLRAEDVLVRARRSHRRRQAALSAFSALVLVAVVAVALRPSGARPPVPAITGAAPEGCSVRSLPLPAGITGGSVIAADPTGRYVIGVPFPSDDMAPAVTILWTDGTPRLLPTGFAGTAVNASGLVAGIRDRLEARRAAVFRDGAVVDLPAPTGATFSEAVAVNARGEIAGTAYLPGTPDLSARAVVWPPGQGTPKLLQASGKDTAAAGVADDGTVVGTIGTREHPYRWTATGTGAALPLPSGYRGGEGQAVTGDWAVGTASTSRGGEDGKDELTAESVVVRWNLRTGALDHGMRIVPTSVSAAGALAGRVGRDEPGIWRDGAVVPLPMLTGGTRGAAATIVGDGHTVAGWSATATGLPAPVIWQGC
ncbi:hypothetical protein AB0J72_20165 [Dactylosporangium sp. NPDC049742]|uniref:hypothetical protein n=1 Tax=Dactylosporangium sp. NPDC049742 TaxID=3154737 RepID=UPI0034315B27